MAAAAESKAEKANISIASDAEKTDENKEEGKGTSLSANLRKPKCKNMTMVEEFCVFCYGTLFSNDEGDIEELLRCSECLKFAHPSCLEIPDIAVENTKLYNWQCNDCKGCFACKKKNKEKSMILCDFCDRGFHTFCLEKKPSRPSKGSWKCPVCKNMESASKGMESASEGSELSSPTKSSQAENDGNDEMKEEANTNLSIVDAGIDGEEISSKSSETISSILNVTASSKKEVTYAKDGITKTDLDVNSKTVKDSKCRENVDCLLLQDTSQLLENSGGKTEEGGDERIAPNASGLVGNLAEITEANKEKVMSLRKSIGTEENQLTKGQNDNMPNCGAESSKGKPGRRPKKIIKPKSERESRRVSKRLSGIPVPMIKESINPIKYNRSDKINKPESDKRLKRKNSDVSKIGSGTEKCNDLQEKMPEPVLNSKVEELPDSEKALDQVSDRLGIDEDAPTLSEFVEKPEVIDNAQEDCGLKPEDLKLAEVDSTSAGNANSSDDKMGNESRGEIVVKRKRGRPRKRRPGEHPNIEKQKLSESLKKKSEKSRFSIILRRPPREPAITPTTSKNISSAQAVRKVYPTRDRETPHPSSPPSALSSPRMSPLKVSPSKNAKSHSKAAKTPPKTPLRTSPRPQKTPKRVESPKTPKSGQKGDKFSTPKRKLPYSEKQEDSKRLKVQSPEKSGSGSKKTIVNDNTAINTRRRSRKGKNYDSTIDNTANGNQKSSDQLDGCIDNIVSTADIALFEQAQSAVKRDFATEEENSLEQGIKKVDFGDYEIDAWYSSPYPSEYKILGKVYICEYCLKYMKSATILRRHMAKCLWRHPPGDEIYRKDSTSVFEVDGEKSPAYCQNLCLLAKLFLDHKTLYYEVEPFLFYVMTAADSSGCHVVGYFSKEKVSFLNYNVSCILVLPHYMRKGYGNVLIDFSYLLSRAAGKIGSPERPLSDLGLISYRSYWKHVLLRYLCSYNEDFVSIKEMSQKTAVLSNDLISTMQALGILKYWKGQHVISLQEDMLDTYMAKLKSRTKLKLEIDEACLRWTLKDYGQSKAKPRNA